MPTGKKKTKRKKMGRPKIEIDKNHFEKLCAMLCTKREIAAWFQCSEDTIERWCKRTYKVTFAAILKEKKSIGEIAIRRKIHQLVEEGHPTMVIWASKNRLGWTDKQEVKQEVKQVTRHVYYPDSGRGDE